MELIGSHVPNILSSNMLVIVGQIALDIIEMHPITSKGVKAATNSFTNTCSTSSSNCTSAFCKCWCRKQLFNVIGLEVTLLSSLSCSLLEQVPACNSGPFHTRAKSRDHEIVRAQKKVSKVRPNTPPKLCLVVTGPSSVVWSHMWLALNQMLFQRVSIHVGPHTW